MVEVVALVEGETEQIFVRDVLAGHLSLHGVAIWAVLSGRSRKRGGVRKWPSARDDIVRLLKEDRYCTTMFDFYALPKDWPGRVPAAALPPAQRSACVEAAVLKAIAEQHGASFDPTKFIPYIQLHEFEALVFADTTELANVAAAASNAAPAHLASRFEQIVSEAGEPEAIDDGYETCPSRRITSIAPAYRKRVHGPIVAGRIGLDLLREKCAHFAGWISKLEQLGSLAPKSTSDT